MKLKSIKETIKEKDKKIIPKETFPEETSAKKRMMVQSLQNQYPGPDQNSLHTKNIHQLNIPDSRFHFFSSMGNNIQNSLIPFMGKNVIILINKILQNKMVHRESPVFKSLNNVERLFIFLFLLRKKKKHKNWIHLNVNSIRPDELEYFIINFNNFTSVKRFEEEFKFLFKYAIQFLKKELETNKIIPYHKKDTFLYKYYFEEISKARDIPLQYFMDPSIVRKNMGNRQIKTFGIQYLKILLSSEKFKKDFINFILKNIDTIYLTKIKRKLNTILTWLADRLQNYDPKNFNKNFDIIKNQPNIDPDDIKKFNIITNYLVYNNQCKLPWSLSEIRTARIRVIRKIEKISNN